MPKAITHGSVFSGIGGFDLPAQWMGWENVFHCELNSFGRRVLKFYWPQATSYEDITKSNFSIWRGRLNVFTGGFPCQDASNAKQDGEGQKGLGGLRTGLFYHMCRAIHESQPEFIVAENVANILKTNGGRDFATILSELSRLGYNAEWRVCTASEVGAPHKRKRLYLVAYSSRIRIQRDQSFFSLLPKTVTPKSGKITGTDVAINVDHEWLRESPVYSLDDGLPYQLDLISKTVEAGGNAVVPQIPYQIFKAIEKFRNK